MPSARKHAQHRKAQQGCVSSIRALGERKGLSAHDMAELRMFHTFLNDKAVLPLDQLHAKYWQYLGYESPAIANAYALQYMEDESK